MSTIVTIPQPCPSYLPGARMFAVLAFPPTSATDPKWRAAELALCRTVLTAHLQLDPAWGAQERLITPDHAFAPTTGIERRRAEIQRRLGHRLGAAHVAMRFFIEAQLRRSGAPPAMHRVTTLDAEMLKTVEQEAARVAWLATQGVITKERFPTDLHNFKNRVFRPSVSVLHLAVAVAVTIDQSQKTARANPHLADRIARRDFGGAQLNIADFILNPDLAISVIHLAKEYEELLPFLPKPRIGHIVKIRLG